jgi:hypothetical protein
LSATGECWILAVVDTTLPVWHGRQPLPRTRFATAASHSCPQERHRHQQRRPLPTVSWLSARLASSTQARNSSARSGPYIRPRTQIDQLVDHRLDPEALGQGGGQQPRGVGDRVVASKRHDEPAWAVGG